MSRRPRPLTPTPRGFFLTHLVSSSTPLQGFQTSTPIHSQPPSSVISPSQGLSYASSNTPHHWNLYLQVLLYLLSVEHSDIPLMQYLCDPYGHLVYPSGTLVERIQTFNRLEPLRDQEASRLEAQAAALRNPTERHDPRLHPKPNKTVFFSTKP